MNNPPNTSPAYVYLDLTSQQRVRAYKMGLTPEEYTAKYAPRAPKPRATKPRAAKPKATRPKARRPTKPPRPNRVREKKTIEPKFCPDCQSQICQVSDRCRTCATYKRWEKYHALPMKSRCVDCNCRIKRISIRCVNCKSKRLESTIGIRSVFYIPA